MINRPCGRLTLLNFVLSFEIAAQYPLLFSDIGFFDSFSFRHRLHFFWTYWQHFFQIQLIASVAWVLLSSAFLNNMFLLWNDLPHTRQRFFSLHCSWPWVELVGPHWVTPCWLPESFSANAAKFFQLFVTLHCGCGSCNAFVLSAWWRSLS